MEKDRENRGLEAGTRLESIQARLRKAAQKRSGEAFPALIGVSKFHSADHIAPFLSAGLTDLGENYVQEATAKFAELKAMGHRFTAHLIGPLQSNKAAEAAELFDVIHTIDRPKIAQALHRACEPLAKRLDVFIQVNIGREAQKAGVAIEELPALIAEVRGLANLHLRGLMAVPPDDLPPSPWFALLAELARRHRLPELSMGMSGDFETAIRLGATHVRVGTALFGERPA